MEPGNIPMFIKITTKAHMEKYEQKNFYNFVTIQKDPQNKLLTVLASLLVLLPITSSVSLLMCHKGRTS